MWTEYQVHVILAPPELAREQELAAPETPRTQEANAGVNAPPLRRPRGALRQGLSAEAPASAEPLNPPRIEPRADTVDDVVDPAVIRPRLGAPSRARWGVGSIISIALALAAFIALAVVLSPWWLLLPIAVFLIMWLMMDRGRVLRSVQAQPADAKRHANLIAHVRNASAVMGIAPPDLHISPQPVINAFALTDRRGGVVCIFQGLLDLLTDEELAAVIAHEVGHIKNRDSLYSIFFESVRMSLAIVIAVIAALLAFAIAMFTRGRGSGALAAIFGAGIVLVGSAVAYILLTFGVRSREYGADRHAAETHTDPFALGRALTRMEQAADGRWHLGEVPAAVAARCIVRPFASGFVSELISSHPTTENRIARIERLVGTERAAQLQRDAQALARRRALRAQRQALDIARDAEPAPFPSDALLIAGRGELLWHIAPARKVEPSHSTRSPGQHIGEEGRLFITTRRAVLLTPSGRTEWLWSELNDRSWLMNGAGAGSILMLGVTRRQRSTGAWFDRRTAAEIAPYIELALAEARGERDAHVAQLEANLAVQLEAPLAQHGFH